MEKHIRIGVGVIIFDSDDRILLGKRNKNSKKMVN